MPETKIKCTACDAVLKLNGPLPQGKSVKCPKCGEPLRLGAKSPASGKSSPASSRQEVTRRPKPAVRKVEEPDEEPDEELDEEAEEQLDEEPDEDLDERDEEEEEAPRKKTAKRLPEGKKKAGKSKRGKKQKEETGGNKKVFWYAIGGGVVLVAGVIILIVALSGSKNKDKGGDNAKGPGPSSNPSNPLAAATPPIVEKTLEPGVKAVELTLDNAGSKRLSLALSQDGTLVAVSGKATDESIKVIDVASGNKLFGLDNKGPIAPIAISPENALLAIGRDSGEVELRDLKTGSVKNQLKAKMAEGTPRRVAFLRGGESIAAVYNRNLIGWDCKLHFP